jgi:hypothetical protein
MEATILACNRAAALCLASPDATTALSAPYTAERYVFLREAIMEFSGHFRGIFGVFCCVGIFVR